MFINLPLQANLETIRQRRQQLIDKNLARNNRRRHNYRYRVGEEVLVKTYDPTKNGGTPPWTIPYFGNKNKQYGHCETTSMVIRDLQY